MALAFSESTNNSGIVEQTRNLAGVDSTQWPTARIANSANHWLDFLTGYAIGADKRFQWDNTQHSKLPEGTTNLVSGQSDYGFTTDEQGNSIITLTGMSVLPSSAATYYQKLYPVDRNDAGYDVATYGQISGTPYSYDKIADNIVRLDVKPSSSITNGLKFFFQRTSPYFTPSSTTATTGFSPLLDRGFIIASAYDAAIALGLPNIQALAAERQKEEQKVIQYFGDRDMDEEAVISGQCVEKE